jgi:hypothetical protein
MRMDPVHLQPDRDHLLLLDNYAIQLPVDQAKKMVEMLNQHCKSEPFSVFMGTAGRWYLTLDDDPQIHTHPLADVIGRNIDPFLMTGSKRQYWQSFLTEVQMLLHAFNQGETTGSEALLPVNSAWLWGEGSLSRLEIGNELPSWDCVCANDALSRGLAIFTGTTLLSVPASAGQCLEAANSHQNQLIVIDNVATALKYGDLSKWQSLVTQFNDDWAVPLLSALKRGELETLLVYEGNGRCYRITGKMAKRWWRRTASLHRCI